MKLLYHIMALSGITLFSIPAVCAEPDTATGKTRTVLSQSAGVGGDSVLSIVLSLLLVIAIIFMFAWIMRRMSGVGFKSSALIKVIGGISMGTRDRIVLIQVGEEQLLLGVSPGRIQTLHRLDTPLNATQNTTEPMAGFADKLKGLMQSGKAHD